MGGHAHIKSAAKNTATLYKREMQEFIATDK